jgi:hypothetical protein
MKKLHRFHLSILLASALAISSLIGPPRAYAADISQTAANVQMSSLGLYKTYPAGVGVTIVAGNAVYYDSNTGTVKLAKANTLGTAVINNTGGGGIAVNSAGPGQLVTYCYQDPSFTLGGTLAVGGVVYVSGGAAGAVTSTYADLTSGMTVIVLGVGNASGNKFYLNPTQGGSLP